MVVLELDDGELEEIFELFGKSESYASHSRRYYQHGMERLAIVIRDARIREASKKKKEG